MTGWDSGRKYPLVSPYRPKTIPVGWGREAWGVMQDELGQVEHDVQELSQALAEEGSR